MISLSLNTVYTDSAPVCPWLTSRPPRKLEPKRNSGRNEEILIEHLPKPTGGCQGQGDRTNQLIYLYLVASKWERTNHASYIATEHPGTSSGQAMWQQRRAQHWQQQWPRGQALRGCSQPGPAAPDPAAQRSAQCVLPCLSFTAECHQISSPNSRKGRSFLLAVPIFLENSLKFEKQAKAIFASALYCS